MRAVSDEALAAMLDAAAEAQGIALPKGSRPGVLRDMRTILDAAATAKAALEREDGTVEIAPVFRA